MLAIAAVSLAIVLVAVGLVLSGVLSSRPRLILATTTSTQNSGLLDYILPDFESKYNVRVGVVAVGSGQAMTLARRGDADVVLSHAPSLEEQFMADGYGLFRWRVMYNQFSIVGPPGDPARVGGAVNATDAFLRIHDGAATFISRGDNSGTYQKELEIWRSAELDPDSFGQWYKSVGKGMEETLLMAEELGAYTLTDEGTYFSLETSLTLKELFGNDSVFMNQYSVIPVNPEEAPAARSELGVAFAEWLVSDSTQQMIASYRVNGHQLFYPNAPPP